MKDQIGPAYITADGYVEIGGSSYLLEHLREASGLLQEHGMQADAATEALIAHLTTPAQFRRAYAGRLVSAAGKWTGEVTYR